MSDSMTDLEKIQAQAARLRNKIGKNNKDFYSKLSKFSSITAYSEGKKNMRTDKDRAEFLCILAKDNFLKNEGKPISLEIKKKGQEKLNIESGFTGLDDSWDISLKFDTQDKKITLSALCSHYDKIEVSYQLDCFTLSKNLLFDENTKGKTEKSKYYTSRHRAELESEGRNDNDVREIIDFLFRHLKAISRKKS